MSRTPSSDPSLEELRQGLVGNPLNGEHWRWLHDQLTMFVQLRLRPRYSAAIYAPGGTWDDEGIYDLVTEFLVERGLASGALQQALAKAETRGAAVKYLERALQNFTISNRKRTTASNVLRRLVQVLSETDCFLHLRGRGASSVFALRASADDREEVSERQLARASRFVPAGIEWKEYHTGERQSPGLTRDDLLRISTCILEGVGHPMSAQQIMGVISARFGLNVGGTPIASSVALDQLPAESRDPLHAIVASEMAKEVETKLTLRQRQIAQLWVGEDLGVREIGQRLGISKSLVSKEQQLVRSAFMSVGANSREEQRQLLRTVSEWLAPRPRAKS